MDVTLCLTHACNLRCGYCYAGRKFNRRMTWQTARKALDFAFEESRREAALRQRAATCQLGFFGGEPLLEWALLQRATDYADQEADRLGIRLKRIVTTNLTLLDERKACWLRDRGFHVGLSLDGNEAMHDTLRRTAAGAPSHADCAKALHFYQGWDSNGEVIVVIDPANIRHLAESIDWLIARNIRRISINPNFTAAWDEASLESWREAYQHMAASYVDAYRRNDPVRINVFDGRIRTRINGGYRACDHCGFGENEVSVSAAGNFYPCERLVGDDSDVSLRIGHVDCGFDPVARARILARRGNDTAECRECPVRDRCVNWCGCVNYASTGMIHRVPGVVCHHEKLSIKTADQAAARLFAERNPAFLQFFYGHLLD